jgi:hypothetical protein
MCYEIQISKDQCKKESYHMLKYTIFLIFRGRQHEEAEAIPGTAGKQKRKRLFMVDSYFVVSRVGRRHYLL